MTRSGMEGVALDRRVSPVLVGCEESQTITKALRDAGHEAYSCDLALDALEKSSAPTPEDWRILSDAVNLSKAMIENGMVTDESGTYESALEAMAVAGARYLEGKRMGFSGTGIQAMRALVSDMADLMAVVSHRDMLKVHNAAAKRVYEVLRGKTRPGDVVVAV